MNTYRELEIFKESKRLAIEVHRMTITLPKFEMYEEGSQARRSSKAVTSMIVEGYGRNRYKKDFVKYLVYAVTESDETIVHLDFLFETESWTDPDHYERLRSDYVTLSKRINTYRQWVEDNWRPRS